MFVLGLVLSNLFLLFAITQGTISLWRLSSIAAAAAACGGGDGRT